MPLHSVFLLLGDKEKPLFSSQLAIFEEDGQKAVFFTTNFEQKTSAYIFASYGLDCGIQVEKSLELALK